MIVWFRIVCSFFLFLSFFLFFSFVFATVSKIGITVFLGNGRVWFLPFEGIFVR